MIQGISSLLSSFPITGKFKPEIKNLETAQEIGKLSTFILSLPVLLAADSIHAALYEPFAAKPFSPDISPATKHYILTTISLATIAAIALRGPSTAPPPPPPQPLLPSGDLSGTQFILATLGVAFVFNKFQPPRKPPRTSIPQQDALGFSPPSQASANPWKHWIRPLKQDRSTTFTVEFPSLLHHHYKSVTVNREELIQSLESYPSHREIVGRFTTQATGKTKILRFNPSDFLPEEYQQQAEESPPSLSSDRSLVRFATTTRRIRI